MTPIQTISITLPVPSLPEIRKYAGWPEGSDAEIRQCIAEMTPLHGKICYRECDIHDSNDILNLEFAKTNSQALRRILQGCEKIILLGATVGLLPDRLIAKYSRISPVKALLMQAVGTERIEAACDAFCEQTEKTYRGKGYTLRHRFSPGYGDLPLSLQKEIFAALDCPRQIGVTLTSSLLMMPTKSVTAIIGLKPNRQETIL